MDRMAILLYIHPAKKRGIETKERKREAAALCNCSIKSNKIRSRNSWLSTKSRTRADAADLPLVIYFIRKWRVIDRQSNRFLMVSGQKGSAVIVNFFFSSFCSTIVQAGRLHRFFPPHLRKSIPKSSALSGQAVRLWIVSETLAGERSNTAPAPIRQPSL